MGWGWSLYVATSLLQAVFTSDLTQKDDSPRFLILHLLFPRRQHLYPVRRYSSVLYTCLSGLAASSDMPSQTLNVILFGDIGVGKSSVINLWLDDLLPKRLLGSMAAR